MDDRREKLGLQATPDRVSGSRPLRQIVCRAAARTAIFSADGRTSVACVVVLHAQPSFV